ncbi:MAG: 3-hydroxyacyl-CoA dehydrogenase/enoyl-CoA hydratase family protein, partial [Rhodospirillales bacterium]|nr:3-hydroxyacyl-CoA dehydrogenase/enoyl-CoA hydratase family protein [Rhodospirillales bacterium]
DVTDDQVRKLERESFMALLRTDPTLARVEHMLDTGRALRN